MCQKVKKFGTGLRSINKRDSRGVPYYNNFLLNNFFLLFIWNIKYKTFYYICQT